MGGVWRLLASLGPLFGVFFWVLVFGMLSKRALGGFLARFWLDFQGSAEGFGEGFERVLGEFGGTKIVVLLDRIFGFCVLVAGAFGGVWGGF